MRTYSLWRHHMELSELSEPLLIPVAAKGKCKQANEFQSRHYGHPTHYLFMSGIGPIRDSRLSYLNAGDW